VTKVNNNNLVSNIKVAPGLLLLRPTVVCVHSNLKHVTELNELPSFVDTTRTLDPGVLVTVDVLDSPAMQLTILIKCPHVITGGHCNIGHMTMDDNGHKVYCLWHLGHPVRLMYQSKILMEFNLSMFMLVIIY